MASEQRPRSHTIPENNQNTKEDFHQSIDVNIKVKKATNRTSLPPESSGKTWKKLFGSNNNNKQTSVEKFNVTLKPDITYITPRLIVMTTPGDCMSNEISRPIFQSLNDHLNTKHGNSYMIYTLDRLSSDQLSNKSDFFRNRVVNLPLFDQNQSLSLICLLWFCQKVTLYLLESPSHVVVLHCIDEKHQLIFGGCSLIAYHKIFSRIDQIIEYYQSKRSSITCLTMSQRRYIEYLCDLSSDYIDYPHFNRVYLKAIHLTPVPLVNKQRTGCRPFIDIYDQENTKIFSTYQDISKLKVYTSADHICMIPVNIFFNGDLTIHITHAAIGHARQTHEGGIRICELTINSNFSTLSHPNLFYSRNELDSVESTEKNPVLFHITIEINHQSDDRIDQEDAFSEQLLKTFKQPLVLFNNQDQFQQIVNVFNEIYSSSTTTTVVRRQNQSTNMSTESVRSIINPRHISYLQEQENQMRLSQQENEIHHRITLLDIQDDFVENENQTNFQQTSVDLLDEDSNVLDTSVLLTPTQLLTNPTTEQKSSSPIETLNTPSTANYNISFQTNPTTSSPSTSTEKPKTDLNIDFGDLFPFKKDQKSPTETSIGQARRAAREKDTDPVVLRVRQWTEGKEKNLRALLCSLSNVTWSECTWKGCQMNELVTNDQVKKVYKKAVLHIHPDKLCGDPNEQLAKLIFVELNEAWSHFDKENS